MSTDLHYEAFAQITHDISDARVYGGIHFRYDMEKGGVQGRRVGAYVYEHALRRVHGDGDDNSVDGADRHR